MNNPVTTLLGAAVHAIVDKMPDQSVDIWVQAGTVATIAAAVAAFAAAIAAAFAAWYTARLAKSTDALAAETGRAVKAGFDAARAEERRHQEGLQPHVALFIGDFEGRSAIWAHNVGPGFARNVAYRIQGGNPVRVYGFDRNYPLAIAPGMKFVIAQFVSDKNNIEIDYLDAFTNHFRTSAASFPENPAYTCEKIVDTLALNP